VSFFVVALILVVYLLADLANGQKARRAGARAIASDKGPGVVAGRAWPSSPGEPGAE